MRRQSYSVGQPGETVNSAMITDDGEVLGAVVGGRPVLYHRDGQALTLPNSVLAETASVASLSADGQYLALASSTGLRIVDLFADEMRTVPTNGICHVAWRKGGQQLVTSHSQNVLNLWTVSGEHLSRISLPVRRNHWRVAFANGEEMLYAASYNIPPNDIYACPFSGPILKAVLPDDRSVSGLVTWQDRVIVATSDTSCHFELTAYSSRLKLIKQVPLNAAITTLAVCPGGDWLAAGTVNGNLWVLDAQTLGITDACTLWAAPVRTVAASAQDCLLAGASDGKLLLVELP